MSIAAQKALQSGSIPEYKYYLATISWLNKDFQTVNKMLSDKDIISMGADETLKRLLLYKNLEYKDAYLA